MSVSLILVCTSQDHVRTDAYRNAIMRNQNFISGKVRFSPRTSLFSVVQCAIKKCPHLLQYTCDLLSSHSLEYLFIGCNRCWLWDRHSFYILCSCWC